MKLSLTECRQLYEYVHQNGELPSFLIEYGWDRDWPYPRDWADIDNWFADHIDWVVQAFEDEIERGRLCQ